MKIESQIVTVEKSANYLFEKLTNVEAYKELMPENIAKFEVLDNNTFVFALKGMPEIKLRLKEKIEYEKVVLGAASDKLPFSLIAHLKEVSNNLSEVKLDFEGEFNPMMAMMVKGPITKFLEALSSNMNKL